MVILATLSELGETDRLGFASACVMEALHAVPCDKGYGGETVITNLRRMAAVQGCLQCITTVSYLCSVSNPSPRSIEC
jgi:hypothetical protein